MTLVVAVTGPESLWLLSDRRLSYKGRAPKEDARKVMFLETTDGLAILGYAGLGATALGTEPADWMSAVLRGRNLPLEQSLGILAQAIKKQLPRHMARLPGDGGPVHNVIVPAFLGDEPRLYTIDIAFAPDRKRYGFRYTRHVLYRSKRARTTGTPRVMLGGSGAQYLMRDRKWLRSLLSLVKANDRDRASSRAVSDHLANLNNEVHLGVTDHSVGPRSIVAWRYKKRGFHRGGGGHQFYTSTTRDPNSAPLPTIGNGMDIHALAEMLMPMFLKQAEERFAGKSADLDVADLNAKAAGLPDKPDENLR